MCSVTLAAAVYATNACGRVSAVSEKRNENRIIRRSDTPINNLCVSTLVLCERGVQ